MKKLLITVGAVAGLALIAKRASKHCGGIDVEQMIERMPDNAPPKWMFQNISAIRANTDRILELQPGHAQAQAKLDEVLKKGARPA